MSEWVCVVDQIGTCTSLGLDIGSVLGSFFCYTSIFLDALSSKSAVHISFPLNNRGICWWNMIDQLWNDFARVLLLLELNICYWVTDLLDKIIKALYNRNSTNTRGTATKRARIWFMKSGLCVCKILWSKKSFFYRHHILHIGWCAENEFVVNEKSIKNKMMVIMYSSSTYHYDEWTCHYFSSNGRR